MAAPQSLRDRLQDWWDKDSFNEDLFTLTDAEIVGMDLTTPEKDKAFKSKVKVSSKPQTKHSRIRVQLSRPLRSAEIEKLYTDHHTVGARLNITRDLNGFLFKLRVSPNGTHIWIDADTPSRLLYEVIAAALDQHFVNVYPTAVRTFTEYNGK